MALIARPPGQTAGSEPVSLAANLCTAYPCPLKSTQPVAHHTAQGHTFRSRPFSSASHKFLSTTESPVDFCTQQTAATGYAIMLPGQDKTQDHEADSGGVKQIMTMTYYFDMPAGFLILISVVVGVIAAVGISLVEALVLFRLGWPADLRLRSAARPQDTDTAPTSGNRFIACLRDSFLANLASTAVGYLLYGFVFSYSFYSIPFWITAFAITLVVETAVLWALRKKPFGRSALASLAINVSSYLLLIAIFAAINWFG